MELVKNYNCSIHYHLGKANIVADAFSRKAPQIKRKTQEQLDDYEAIITTIRVHFTIIK